MISLNCGGIGAVRKEKPVVFNIVNAVRFDVGRAVLESHPGLVEIVYHIVAYGYLVGMIN